MARQSVLRRGELVDSFTATLTSCAGKIGAGFRRLTEPYLQPGEEVPDLTLAVVLLGRAISDRFSALLRDDRTDFDERANDAIPRARILELAGTLHSQLVDLRQLAKLAYGEVYSLTLVPVQGTTATAPSEVYRQSQHTLERLEKGQEDPPEVRMEGLEPDLAKWADGLRPHVTDLGVALGVVKAERTKASATAEEKKRSMKELDFLYVHSRYIVRGLLFLAGLNKPAQELKALGRSRRAQVGPVAEEPLPRTDEPEPGTPP